MLRATALVVAMWTAWGAATVTLAKPLDPAPTAGPSQFDYLVLASMADSYHPVSMATYRPLP